MRKGPDLILSLPPSEILYIPRTNLTNARDVRGARSQCSRKHVTAMQVCCQKTIKKDPVATYSPTGPTIYSTLTHACGGLGEQILCTRPEVGEDVQTCSTR